VELFIETAYSYLLIKRPPLKTGAVKAMDNEETPCVELVIVGAPGLVPPPK
jgi:hypothetical protein